MIEGILLPGLGALLLLFTVPLGIVRATESLSAKLAQRTRIKRHLRGRSENAMFFTTGERLDAWWSRLHLSGSPIEWIGGGVLLGIVSTTVAQLVFHNWVMDVGLPIDMLFGLAYLVSRSHRATFDKHMVQMATAFHIIATEFNVQRNVNAALLQAYERLPIPVNLQFKPTIKMLTSGVAPVQALDKLGRDLGPPYGKLFAATLEQGLTSDSIDKLLVQIATMTEEWQAARRHARSAVVGPQMIGLLLNGAFYFTAFGVKTMFPQVAVYQAAHPGVYIIGIVSVAVGFVMAMIS